MSQTYTKREIAYQLQVSPRTIHEDVKFLQLTPTVGDRGTNLFSQSDFNLIKQLRSHCADKTKGRESFVPLPEIEVLEPELTVRRMPSSRGDDFRLSDISESLKIGLNQNPVFDLEILQKIADNHWLYPASRLAPIFGITPGYLNRKKIYLYCGFIANKEAYGSDGSALWKISANNQ